MASIGILGAGTWGIALARMLANAGHAVTVWSALPSEVEQLAAERRHPNLPGMVIPESVIFTKDIREACEKRDVLVFAVPSVYVRSTAKLAAPWIGDSIIVDVAKGIEAGSLLTMTQIIAQETTSEKIVALSGPTHAEEVARDLPTTIVSACKDDCVAKIVQDIFSNDCMRVYTNRDILGVELCGALKNIMALATGIGAGMGHGDNAKAALITRGITEMTRLGRAMGCETATFAGLAGIGDLIVTATSVHSRNNRCGILIGSGVPVQEAIRQVGMVVEGINALPAAVQLAQKYQVEMPILSAVEEIVIRGVEPCKAVQKLMEREKKAENDLCYESTLLRSVLTESVKC